MTCEYLQHRLLDFTEVAFWGGQGKEYNFTVPGDHLKHCFLDDVSRARMELTTNYRPLDLPKSELDEFNKACFLVVLRHCGHIFWPWPTQIAIWLKSKKRWMKMWNGNLKSFYASWLTENANFIKSIKRRFNWSNGTIKSYSASWCAQISSSMMSGKQCFKLTPGTGISFSSS